MFRGVSCVICNTYKDRLRHYCPPHGGIAGKLLKTKDQSVAERVGFEPTVGFPLHTLSKRAPSTTRTSLRLELATCSDAQLRSRTIVISPPISRDHLRPFQYSRPSPAAERDVTAKA